MELVLREMLIYIELYKNEVLFTIGCRLDHPRGELCYQYLLKKIVLEKYYGLPPLCMYLDSLDIFKKNTYSWRLTWTLIYRS